MAAEHFTKETYEAVRAPGVTALVDFYADWCGPCKMLAPLIEELAGELTDVKVGKVNVDENQDLAAEFGVMSIPTVVALRDGKEVQRTVGFTSKAKLLSMLEA